MVVGIVMVMVMVMVMGAGMGMAMVMVVVIVMVIIKPIVTVIVITIAIVSFSVTWGSVVPTGQACSPLNRARVAGFGWASPSPWLRQLWCKRLLVGAKGNAAPLLGVWLSVL